MTDAATRDAIIQRIRDAEQLMIDTINAAYADRPSQPSQPSRPLGILEAARAAVEDAEWRLCAVESAYSTAQHEADSTGADFNDDDWAFPIRWADERYERASRRLVELQDAQRLVADPSPSDGAGQLMIDGLPRADLEYALPPTRPLPRSAPADAQPSRSRCLLCPAMDGCRPPVGCTLEAH